MSQVSQQNLHSAVCEYFIRDIAKGTATCILCKATLKAAGGSTKSLHTHLQSKHKITLIKCSASTVELADGANTADEGKPLIAGSGVSASGASVSKYLTLDNFVISKTNNSMAATVARMTACDGLPFCIFSTSRNLQRLMNTSGYTDLPKSAHSAQPLVLKHAVKIRSMTISELKLRLKQGRRFSLTFDEWTSLQNRRYMVVNVHDEGPHFWSLGLVCLTVS
jgi:hypothetical protein